MKRGLKRRRMQAKPVTYQTAVGRVSSNSYALDLSMLAILDAGERTLEELLGLASRVGWRFVRVMRPRASL